MSEPTPATPNAADGAPTPAPTPADGTLGAAPKQPAPARKPAARKAPTGGTAAKPASGKGPAKRAAAKPAPAKPAAKRTAAKPAATKSAAKSTPKPRMAKAAPAPAEQPELLAVPEPSAATPPPAAPTLPPPAIPQVPAAWPPPMPAAHATPVPAPSPTPEPALDWPPPRGQRSAGRPISLAGADVPARLVPAPPPDAAAAAPAPAVEPALAPAAAPVEQHPAALPAPPAASAASAPSPAAPDSAAPPGFSAPSIRAAASPSLLALDPPVEEPESAAPTTADGDAPIAGSLLLTRALELVPQRGDHRRFGADRAATTRVSVAVLVASLLVVVLGGPIFRLFASLPLLGTMTDQLESLVLYVTTYRLEFATPLIAALGLTAFVLVQTDRLGHRSGQSRPLRELNFGLAALLSITITAGALATLNRYGWAAAASATLFFIALCLLLPIGRLPGARAMQHLPARAWVLALGLGLIALFWSPSLPIFIFVALALTTVRTGWKAVFANEDAHAAGPIDQTNRLSAVLILATVLVASVVGLQAMMLAPEEIDPPIERPTELLVPDLPGQPLPKP